MEATLQLQVHGMGNAWPVLLGGDHPLYDRNRPGDLSNAAYSLLLSREGHNLTEVLLDAGHGTMQSLLGGRNRIPECICLTHAHMDHTLAVDWLVQSHWRAGGNGSPYPVYASQPVFNSFISSYPHLGKLVKHIRLEFGKAREMEHAPGFNITAFPVYHGPRTPGASMFLFETERHRILFTGDLLATLLRKKDLVSLSGLDLLVPDINNRFPWPGTNHWSIAGQPENWKERGPALKKFIDSFTWEALYSSYQTDQQSIAEDPYYEALMEEEQIQEQSFTLMEFLEKVHPRKVMPVHYSGSEDLRHYSEKILDRSGMKAWMEKIFMALGIRSQLIMPESGQILTIL